MILALYYPINAKLEATMARDLAVSPVATY